MRYLLLLSLLFCFKVNAQKEISFKSWYPWPKKDTVKAILLCIDTSVKITKAPYPIEQHTLFGTGLLPDDARPMIEERSYDTRCFWQYGYVVNSGYLDKYKDYLPKKLIVLLPYIIK